MYHETERAAVFAASPRSRDVPLQMPGVKKQGVRWVLAGASGRQLGTQSHDGHTPKHRRVREQCLHQVICKQSSTRIIKYGQRSAL